MTSLTIERCAQQERSDEIPTRLREMAGAVEKNGNQNHDRRCAELASRPIAPFAPQIRGESRIAQTSAH